MPALSSRLNDALPTLGAAWRWWTGELAGLIPKRLSLSLARTRTADIYPSRDGVALVRTAQGQGERLVEVTPITAFTSENWQEIAALVAGHRTRVILRAPLAHIITLRLPKAARPYLRTAVPLQLGEHAPLPLDSLAWALVDTRLDHDRLFARVAMVRRDVIETLEAGFHEQALSVPPILVETSDGKRVTLRRERGAAALPRPWTWAVIVLALTPFLLLLFLEILVLHEQSQVTGLEEAARPALAAERHIREQAQVARGLNQLFVAPAVTSIVENLADQLPASAHALELSGREGGLVDITVAASDPKAAGMALLADPRLTAAARPTLTTSPDGNSTLHITAHVR
jgi:hypothetical protein